MFQICFCQCQFYFLCLLVWQWRGAGPNFVQIRLGRIGVDTYTNFVLLLDTSGVVRGTQLVFIANPMVLVRNKFNSIQFPLFPKKLVFIWKKVYHKVSSMNFVKKKRRGLFRYTILSRTKLCNKKMLKVTLYFFPNF